MYEVIELVVVINLEETSNVPPNNTLISKTSANKNKSKHQILSPDNYNQKYLIQRMYFNNFKEISHVTLIWFHISARYMQNKLC